MRINNSDISLLRSCGGSRFLRILIINDIIGFAVITDPIDTKCSIRQVITLEDELEEDARIKGKFWDCKFIPFHSSVSEKVRINLVNIEVYGSIVSCVSSVLSNVQEDDTKMISTLVVEAVDTDT
ncbi:Hypothetical predicted protein, partial [Mytilus galloprovincialis]